MKDFIHRNVHTILSYLYHLLYPLVLIIIIESNFDIFNQREGTFVMEAIRIISISLLFKFVVVFYSHFILHRDQN